MGRDLRGEGRGNGGRREAHGNTEFSQTTDMMLNQALLLLLSHRIAAGFFLGRAALQDKVSQFE